MSQTILFMDKGHPGQEEALAEDFTILRPGKPDPEKIIREHKDEIKAIATILTPVSRSLIEALPNLEIIAVGAVGYDHVDIEAAEERDIVVTYTPEVVTADTADTALLHVLNLARRAVEGDAFVRAGMWKNASFPLGTCMAGKTCGIVGLGRIGKAVAERVEAFGMDVIYFGPREKPDEPYPYYDDLEAMAEACDFMVLTCPGGTMTQHLVNHRILKALGKKGYIVNVARGSVIKEEDLLVALRNKDIAGAGLDVYEEEPSVPEILFTMDNVVLTPHIGTATRETRKKMGQLVVDNLKAYFAGRDVITRVRTKSS